MYRTPSPDSPMLNFLYQLLILLVIGTYRSRKKTYGYQDRDEMDGQSPRSPNMKDKSPHTVIPNWQVELAAKRLVQQGINNTPV